MKGTQEDDWGQLGTVPALELTAARSQLHWAAQAMAVAADVVLTERSDDSHTNMFWDESRRALVGRPDTHGRSVALLVEELALDVHLAESGESPRLRLSGLTVQEAMTWIGEQLETAQPLTLRGYDVPEHELGRGGRFSFLSAGAFGELARWYVTGSEALSEAVALALGASEIAVWPHHFDVGGILFLPGVPSGEAAPQIGFGLSPGDTYYAEPYYYVTPWPLPENADLPPLPHRGVWRSGEFTGAILTATAILELSGGANRARAVLDFLQAAISGGTALIERRAEN